jgi:hypothetical protein
MSKTLVARSSAAALISALAAPAFAGPVYETGNGGSFQWYGQLNPSFLRADDGSQTTSEFADNSNSNSRVGFWLNQAFGENTLKFRFETALGLGGSSSVSQTGKAPNLSWDRTDLRHVDLQFETASYGRFSAGQGSMASDGAGGVALSGTGVAQSLYIADTGGSVLLRDSTGALTGVALGDAFTTYDGGRLGRVRYDSPEFANLTFSASYGNDILRSGADRTVYDAVIGYSNDELAGLTVEGALGASWTDNAGAETRDTFASVSALHEATGLSASFSAGDRDTGGSYGYAKLGYTAQLLAAGDTSFSIDYFDGSDAVTAGDSSSSWGVAAVQKIDRYNVEAYVAYRDYSYEDTSATVYQDANTILAGARFKF